MEPGTRLPLDDIETLLLGPMIDQLMIDRRRYKNIEDRLHDLRLDLGASMRRLRPSLEGMVFDFGVDDTGDLYVIVL